VLYKENETKDLNDEEDEWQAKHDTPTV